MAAIASTTSASKNCLGAEVQEKKEKKKKERVVGNLHPLSES